MSIFFSYIFRQAASALIIIILSLGGVVWIAMALKQLNVVTTQGQNALTFITMTTLALPHLLAVIAPFALLIAVVHALNRLNGDSELIVLTASGANIWVVGRPLLLLALIVTVAVGFTNHIGMPWSLQLLKRYIIEVRTDLLTQVIQPGRFSTPESGLTFHIRDRTFQGELLGLVVDDRRKEGEAQSYLADRAQILKQEDATYLVMRDGHILRRAAGQDGAQIVEFDQYVVDLDQFDRQTPGQVYLKPRERYLHQLLSPDPDDPLYKRAPGKFTAELHERLSNPLYPLAFVLIALATVGQAQSTRQNRSEQLVTAIAAGFACRLGGLGVNNLVALDPTYAPVMYAIPLGAMVVSLLVIWRSSRQQRRVGWRDRMRFFIEDTWARLRPTKSATKTGGVTVSNAPTSRHPSHGPPGLPHPGGGR